MSARNRVGAAWSAWRMVTYEPAHGAEICPLSAITCPFSPLPKSVRERGVNVHPWPRPPIATLDDEDTNVQSNLAK